MTSPSSNVPPKRYSRPCLKVIPALKRGLGLKAALLLLLEDLLPLAVAPSVSSLPTVLVMVKAPSSTVTVEGPLAC